MIPKPNREYSTTRNNVSFAFYVYYLFIIYFCYWQKLKDYPTKDKYYFHIEKVSLLVGCPAAVQSLSSKEYLASDENGKAFMKPDVDTVRDRQTWFGFHGSYFDHTLNKSEATVQFQQQDLPDGGGESTDPENKVQDELVM